MCKFILKVGDGDYDVILWYGQNRKANQAASPIPFSYCLLSGLLWRQHGVFYSQTACKEAEAPLNSPYGRPPLLSVTERCLGNQKSTIIKKKISVKSHLNCVTPEEKSIATISEMLLIWKSPLSHDHSH